jgi:putative SOS response-associated peptidase YedK
MCSNYQPVTRMDRLVSFFGVERTPELDPSPTEIWSLGLAPFIRLAEDGSGNRVVDLAQFGMMPPQQAELAYGRKTYNARTETIAALYTYKGPWAKGQRCIIPTEAMFEFCYETGSPVRWCIQQYGQVPMGLAGIYRRSKGPEGTPMWSFSMATINAEGHPVYERMHPRGKEPRMPVILDPSEYGDWLTCPVDEARKYFRQWRGELETFAAPLPPRPRKAKETGPP